jgi:hypothetical protein
MITDEDRIAAEKELAELKGWYPVYDKFDNEPIYWIDGDGYIAYADWCYSLAECFSLMVEYGCYPCDHHNDPFAQVSYWVGDEQRYARTLIADHPTKELAVMWGVCQAAIAKLEAEQRDSDG